MNHYRDACTAQKLSKCSKDSLEPKIEDAKFVEKFGDILLERVENVLRSVELYRDDWYYSWYFFFLVNPDDKDGKRYWT